MGGKILVPCVWHEIIVCFRSIICYCLVRKNPKELRLNTCRWSTDESMSMNVWHIYIMIGPFALTWIKCDVYKIRPGTGAAHSPKLLVVAQLLSRPTVAFRKEKAKYVQELAGVVQASLFFEQCEHPDTHKCVPICVTLCCWFRKKTSL